MHHLHKVLILSASYGEGHQQAALAVKDALLQNDICSDVRVIDYMKVVHPILNSVARYCYLKSVRFVPSLYGMFYRRTSLIPPSSMLQRRLNQLGIDELREILDTYKPTAVVSTFPTPAGVLSVLKEQGATAVPSTTVITDHAVHSQWIHPRTDLYFVGSERVKRGLLRRGIPNNKIAVTGIPIRSAFSELVDQAAVRQEYGLSATLPTLLIMGGAYGVLGDFAQICEELFQFPKQIQILVVCGRNEKLLAHMEAAAKLSVNTVKVFGFVPNVHHLMRVSNVILTKAGGLTISESLATELPMLLYKPIPGQEEQNARFLVRSHVALLAKTKPQIYAHLERMLIHEPDLLKDMSVNTRLIARPDAAQNLVQLLGEVVKSEAEQYSYTY